MARRYVRDAKGRFAPKGYTGQTGGRGARLKGGGKQRAGGGAIAEPRRAGEIKNTIAKSSAKRRINANSRVVDRQIARDVAAKAKPASRPSVTRRGGRIDPAKQADRASTAKVNKAMSAERAARAAAFSSKDAFSSPRRQELNRKLDEATRNSASEMQTRRNVRASFPVMRRTPTVKGSRPSSTIKAPSSTKAQRDRASRNLARSLDSRGRAVGKKDRRTKKVAERAAQFYNNPMKALKSVTYKGTGFKLPRSLRR